jgi:hypothetical protein
MFVELKNSRSRTKGSISSTELFNNCYFFRQVCDIVNGDGITSQIFDWLFKRNARAALLFACMQLYSVAMFVQLGFATTNTVLSGEYNSLLTHTSQITTFKVSLASACLSTIITFCFFLMFSKWRYDIKIFANAKYSFVLSLLLFTETSLACASLVLSFQNMTPGLRNYIFPILKVGLTAFGAYCIWLHRPNADSKDMLYFGRCDSAVCTGKNEADQT